MHVEHMADHNSPWVRFKPIWRMSPNPPSKVIWLTQLGVKREHIAVRISRRIQTCKVEFKVISTE